MLIRPATPADIPAMRAIETHSKTSAHWSAEAYETIFSGERRRMAFVYEDEQVIGFVVGSHTGADWEIENVVVAEPARLKGVGSRLIGMFVSFALLQGADSVLLEVRESNTSARRFYEKQKFQEVGRRRGYYDNPSEDAVLYRIRPKE